MSSGSILAPEHLYQIPALLLGSLGHCEIHVERRHKVLDLADWNFRKMELGNVNVLIIRCE